MEFKQQEDPPPISFSCTTKEEGSPADPLAINEHRTNEKNNRGWCYTREAVATTEVGGGR